MGQPDSTLALPRGWGICASNRMNCPVCQARLTLDTEPLEVRVGATVVESRSCPHYRCPTCQRTILEPDARRLLSIQAAIIVLTEGKPDREAANFARGLLDLSPLELGRRLELDEESIVGIEGGQIRLSTQYALSLAALLGTEERRLRGLPHGGARIARMAPSDT